ncbi:hypothetical protein [Actinospica sp.]|uniref:hypothetical protein n=1 Tax=Actinospica sp. TaxID=1872142 RepID=UPI002C055160|nr:hypothetical protein [Actinospica sp.]HWG27624.1 hypothetical protein [Actinospica sp.]
MFESWLGAEMGRDPGCAACARHAEGAEAAALRHDEQALELWAPVLAGDLVCEHQPHGVLGAALMVLVRQDRIDDAIHHHRHGYRISRRKPRFRAAIGEHLEFCALAGPEHRGLELLAEHADWLTEPAPGHAAQAEFLTGASVLLARLVALGHAELPVPMPPSPGAHMPTGEELTVGVLRGFVDAELDSLTVRITRAEQEAGREPHYAARLRIRRLRQHSLAPFDLPTRSTMREPSREPPPFAEPAAAHLEVSGMEDLYALTDMLYQAGELEEVGTALRQVIERSVAAKAPWYAARAEMNLSRLVAAEGDKAAAVRYARASVMDCVDSRLRGAAALTLANALWELDGREAEAILPALESAGMFAAEDRNAEAAMARLQAADALAYVGRRSGAVNLYQRSFAELDDDEYWDPQNHGRELANHCLQYGRALLQVGEEKDGLALLDRLAQRLTAWEDDGARFEVAVNTAYTLRDCEQEEQAYAAFLRVAELACGNPDRLRIRVRSLRSAAWLIQGADLPRAIELMDQAGSALVRRLNDEPEPDRSELRIELAETHLQRGELARNRGREALQDAAAAYAGLRQGLEFREAQSDGRPFGLYRRLVDAAMFLGQLEVARFGSPRSALDRLRGLVEELETAGDEGFAELVKELTVQIDEYDEYDAGDGEA